MIARAIGLGATALVGLALVVALLLGFAFGCKEYSRYQGRQDAKNDLVRAQSTRRIKVEEAIASRLSAVELAKAEVERARGVAQANKIIADSITPAYLRYFYIQQLAEVEHAGGTIIYVPTEAGLPILEARRLDQEQGE